MNGSPIHQGNAMSPTRPSEFLNHMSIVKTRVPFSFSRTRRTKRGDFSKGFGLTVIALTLVLAAFSAVAAPQFKSVRQIDAAVRKEMAKQQAVGVAVGLIKNNRIVYLKGYGYADREKRTRVDRNTMFRWASISKCLTAVAALQLREQKTLKLYLPVRTYVPEFPDKHPPIKTLQLLSHLGGIVHYSNGRVIRTEREYDTPHPYEDVILALDTFKESPLVSRPGVRHSYSSHGFILASAVVQRAGKQKFADQVNERIAKPAGMTTLQPDYQWVDIPNRAAGYIKKDGKVVRDTDTDVSWKLGGGGFISNIDDLALFATGLLSDTFMERRTRVLLWMPQRTNARKPIEYALGFNVSGVGKDLKISHSGSQEKAKTRMVLYPNRGTGVVVMCNSRHVNPGDITTALFPFVE